MALISPLAVQPAAAAGLDPGDIVVADQATGAIVRVDPDNGDQTVLSSGGFLVTPRGLAIDASGGMLVAVRYGLINGIVRVDPSVPNGSPGNQTVVSSGGHFVAPADLAIDANGDILVADFFGGVIKVHPETGVQTVVSAGDDLVVPVEGSIGCWHLPARAEKGWTSVSIPALAGSAREVHRYRSTSNHLSVIRRRRSTWLRSC